MQNESPSKASTPVRPGNVLPEGVIFGCSSVMAEVRARAAKICRTNVPVLICGEGGTGKEVLAQWIHANSEYATGDFVKVNCAAIPASFCISFRTAYFPELAIIRKEKWMHD